MLGKWDEAPGSWSNLSSVSDSGQPSLPSVPLWGLVWSRIVGGQGYSLYGDLKHKLTKSKARFRDVTEAGVSLCGPYMSDALHVSAPGPTFPGKEQSKV